MLWASSLQKDHWKFADLSWAGNRGSQKDCPEGHCQGQEVAASHQGWPPCCGNRSISKAQKREGSTIPRHAKRARCNWKNRGSDLAASMCGVGHTSFTCWDRECHATGLRSPVSLGPPIISQGLRQEIFRDLLIWGEAICKSRVEEGGGTRVADFIQPMQPLRMRPLEKI